MSESASAVTDPTSPYTAQVASDLERNVKERERVAAEITASLGRARPERVVKTAVVRTTLEGLVARDQAQRTKQGTSVFHTAPDGAGRPAGGGKDARS